VVEARDVAEDLGMPSEDAVVELRRREHQQSLVAELGRSAVTGTARVRLVELAVAAVAAGLDAEQAALFQASADGELVASCTLGWPVDEGPGAVVEESHRIEDPVVGATAIATPVRGEERIFGVLAAAGTGPFSSDDVLFLRGLANLVAAAFARDRAEEARQRSEAALGFLAETGHLLNASLDYEKTLSTLADLVVPRLADWFILDVAQEDGTMRRVAVRAASPEKQELLDELHREYQAVIGSGQPAAQALATGGTVHFTGFTPESLRETTLDERHYELMAKLDPQSAIAVALVARGRVLGALTFAWAESGHRYTDADVAMAEELARRAAIAIDNSRLYAAAEQAQQWFGFLVDASDVLASSLDYDETLGSLARLAVPHLGDWCVIYILADDGSIERRAVEHAGGQRDTVRKILDAHPINPESSVGIPHVIRTGKSELLPEASKLSLAADTERSEELVREIETIEVRSTMCVPLIARRRTLGAILFVSAESGRTFDESDLKLAEELAARAAVAVDNSRLFHEAESRAEAARALDSIADAVFLVDARGTIRLWNAAAASITGLDGTVVRGRQAGDVLSGWHEIAAAPGGAPRTLPVTIDGRELWISISGVESGEGTAYAFRDVTADRVLDRLKSDFVATVSHELRTPLAAVYGAAMTLAGRDFGERDDLRRALVTQIAEQAARLSAIVDDILLVGRLEAGGLTLEAAAVDPLEVARAAVEAARILAGVTHEVDLRTEEDVPEIQADAGRLRQVLDNLLDNAVKYSPRGGRVELRVEAGDRCVRFVVTDSGVGIPSSEHDRVFEKFYRLDPQQTRGVSGTGLGLYVCRELVERMDGRITLQSIPGRGSAFTVELPRRS